MNAPPKPTLIGVKGPFVTDWGHERYNVLTSAGLAYVSRTATLMAQSGHREMMLDELRREFTRLGCPPP